MAELRRHTDFSAELKTYEGPAHHQYFLQLATIALAKNPTYTAEQKHDTIRRTIQLLQRAETEQPTRTLEDLIGFPKPSEKELAKPVKDKKRK